MHHARQWPAGALSQALRGTSAKSIDVEIWLGVCGCTILIEMTDSVNRLYFGDNLPILREDIADESVDLIYLDPPFNSNATYNVLFRENRVIGIIHFASLLMKSRSRDSFGAEWSDYEVVIVPQGDASAKALALEGAHDRRYQLEYWAVDWSKRVQPTRTGGRGRLHRQLLHAQFAPQPMIKKRSPPVSTPPGVIPTTTASASESSPSENLLLGAQAGYPR